MSNPLDNREYIRLYFTGIADNGEQKTQWGRTFYISKSNTSGNMRNTLSLSLSSLVEYTEDVFNSLYHAIRAYIELNKYKTLPNNTTYRYTIELSDGLRYEYDTNKRFYHLVSSVYRGNLIIESGNITDLFKIVDGEYIHVGKKQFLNTLNDKLAPLLQRYQ